MYCTEWIKTFLEERNLDSFDGNPVYTYRIEDDEFSELKVSIQMDLDALIDITSYSFTTCIVIYSCEWWRREYKGGHWIWNPIFESLDIETPKPSVRAQIIEKGFDRIKRSIARTKVGEKDYIGSIALESGIPRSLLTEEHYLSKVIADGYQQFLEMSSFEQSEIEIVEEICRNKWIPNTYRNEFFYELVLRLVNQLISLNNRFDLRALENPVEFLDDNYPQWEDDFPIVADSETAITFINELLSETSKKRDPAPLDRLRIKTELLKNQDCYMVRKLVNLKQGIINCSDLGITLSEWNELSDISELYVHCLGDEKKLLGSIYKVSSEGNFNSTGFENMIISNSIFDDIRLLLEDPITFKSIEARLDSVSLSDNDNPLVFQKKGESWEYKSEGSCRLKKDIYRVLVRDEYQVSKFSKELPFLEEGVKLFEIDESSRIFDSRNSFSIRFSEAEEVSHYHVIPLAHNSISFYPSKNQGIYIGMPRIYRFNSEGVLIERILHDIEYFGANGQWQTLKDGIYGKLKIRKRESDGSSLFSFFINLLPKEFEVDFDQSNTESSVSFKGLDCFERKVFAPIDSSIRDNSIIFKNSSQLEEDSFRLELSSAASPFSLRLHIPLPKDITSFRGSNGHEISSSHNVYLGNLLGLRFTTNNLRSTRKRGAIKLELSDSYVTRQITSHISFELDAYSTFEFPLISLKRRVEAIFSLTSNNDALVRLSYNGHALNIRQFDSKPIYIDNTFSFKKPVDRVSAFRLDIPFLSNEDSVISIRVKDNKLIYEGISEGLWFIFPEKESGDFFRPVVLTDLFQKTGQNEFQFLHEASVVKDFEERLVVLSGLLEKMAIDPSNSQWKQLEYLFSATDHLPMSILDIWRAATLSDFTLVSMFFIMPENIIRRLTDEFAILWRSIKVIHWKRAFENYCNYLQNLPLPSSLTGDIISRKLELMRSMLGLMTIKSFLDNTIEPLPSIVFSIVLNDALNGSQGQKGLKSRRADDEWPDHLQSEVKQWLKVIPKHILEHFSHIPNYQKPVVFLPVILAFNTVSNEAILLELEDIQVRYMIEQIKEFDPEWFQFVFDITQGFLMTNSNENA